jgi:hypothetical protein
VQRLRAPAPGKLMGDHTLCYRASSPNSLAARSMMHVARSAGTPVCRALITDCCHCSTMPLT